MIGYTAFVQSGSGLAPFTLRAIVCLLEAPPKCMMNNLGLQ